MGWARALERTGSGLQDFFEVAGELDSRLHVVGSDGEVAHFATGPGFCFSVKVKVGARGFEDGVPVGLAGAGRSRPFPRITEDVDHDGGWRGEADVAEGQTGDGADVLFELAGDAGVEGPVAAVVGAGGHFVDEELAVIRQEEFHREQSGEAKPVGDGFGEGAGLILDGGLDAGGQDGEVEDVLCVDVFRDGEAAGFADGGACDDDGELALEIDPLLDDGALVLEAGHSEGEGGVVGDLLLAFAVVAEVGGFHHAGQADGAYRRGEVSVRLALGEADVGEVVFTKPGFLPEAVLGDFQNLPVGVEGCGGF